MEELKPSEEQQDIINSFSDLTKSIKIIAGPGSGKSTLAKMVAKKVYPAKCLLITYNKSLQVATQLSCEKEHITNLEVRTYHSVAGKLFNENVNDDMKMIDCLQRYKDKSISYPNPFDILILDEAQDMTIHYYLLILRLIQGSHHPLDPLEKIPPSRGLRGGTPLLVLGDPKQNVNSYIGSREEFLTRCDKLFPREKWLTKKLSTSYRLTPAIATFVNNHILGTQRKLKDAHDDMTNFKIVGGNLSAPNLKPKYYAIEFGFMAKELGKIIKTAITTYGYKNVAILAPTIKTIKQQNSKNPLAVAVREYLGGIPLYIPKDNEVLDEATTKGKLTICTWISMKGCERDCIILINFDETYFQYFDREWTNTNNVPNVMYVAATRAKKELIILADPTKTLRSMNIASLDNDVELHFKTKKKDYLTRFVGKDDDEKKTTTFELNNLLRHLDHSLMHELISMVTIKKDDKETYLPKESPNFSITFQGGKPPLTPGGGKLLGEKVSDSKIGDGKMSDSKMDNKTSETKEEKRAGGDEGGSAPCYKENVTGLYELVVLARAELEKNGTTPFGSKVHLPKVVKSLDEKSYDSQGYMIYQNPNIYCITEKAYKNMPKNFWKSVKTAYRKEVALREKEDWFYLAMAENMFFENSFHTARQIINYDWIDETFIKRAVKCIIMTLQNYRGEFNKVYSQSLHGYHLFCKVPFKGLKSPEEIKKVIPVVWVVKCQRAITNNDILYVAGCLAMSECSVGYFYSLLGGDVYVIEFKDVTKKEVFLTKLLSKFDKRLNCDLLTDIENFKSKHGL